MSTTKLPAKALKLLPLFKSEVCDRSKEIDELEAEDWFSLSIGWAIAKGLSPAQAHAFSLHVRYDLHYWQ